MTATPKKSEHFQSIAVPARGRPLHYIREVADERDLPFGKAVIAIIEDHLKAIDAADDAEAAHLAANVVPASIPTELLIAEIGRRVSQATPEELAALNARAEAAERKLAAVQAAIGAAS